MFKKKRETVAGLGKNKILKHHNIFSDRLSVDPVIRKPRASRASMERQASLPQPLFALDSEQNRDE